MHQALPSYLRSGRRLEEVPTHDNHNDESFLILLTVIVALVCLFYVLCTYQLVRRLICQWLPNSDVEDTVLVHEGRVFNLTGNQRRAVLEAIFSKTSKVRWFLGFPRILWCANFAHVLYFPLHSLRQIWIFPKRGKADANEATLVTMMYRTMVKFREFPRLEPMTQPPSQGSLRRFKTTTTRA
jgi:hypothetical protein